MRLGEYHSQSGSSTALLDAAAELRLLSKFGFLLGNSSEGLLFAQLAVDLLRLSAGASLRSTCLWRSFASQFPELFQIQEDGHG